MDTTYAYLARDFQAFNNRLFMEIGAIVTCIEPTQDGIDIHMLSNCGSIWYEISSDWLNGSNWTEDLYQFVIANSNLLSELQDCRFKSFSKSELFRSVCEEIIYPIQIVSDFSPFGRYEGGIEIEAEEIILTGIRHADSNGHKIIEHIRGEIPAADEFYIWQEELDCFAKPDKYTLSECIEQIAPRILEIGESEFDITDLKKVTPPQLFTPQSPQELWKMHRLMGTERRGGGIA